MHGCADPGTNLIWLFFGPERGQNPDQNTYHVPDQKISDQKSGPRTKIHTGPDFWYGPAIHGDESYYRVHVEDRIDYFHRNHQIIYQHDDIGKN